MGASVLIVDDHSGFRAQARRMLEAEGYRVVGEAGDVASAIEAARTLGPELALVDVYLPDGDGFEVASRLRSLDAGPAVVLTSEPRWRGARLLRGRERRLRVCAEDRAVARGNRGASEMTSGRGTVEARTRCG